MNKALRRDKRGVSPIYATVLLVAITISLAVFVFNATTIQFGSITKGIEKEISSSVFVNFDIKTVTQTRDTLMILVENQENKNIESFNVVITTATGELVQRSSQGVKAFETAFVDIPLNTTDPIKSVSLIPITRQQNNLLVHSQSSTSTINIEYNVVITDEDNDGCTDDVDYISNESCPQSTCSYSDNKLGCTQVCQPISCKGNEVCQGGTCVKTTKEQIRRTLACPRCGQHKTPPITQVNISLELSGQGETLEDIIPSSWIIESTNSGTLVQLNQTHNKVTWNISGVVNPTVSYLVVSPQKTTPPTKYLFISSVDSTQTDSYDVIVADPTLDFNTWSADIAMAPLDDETFVLAWTNVSSNNTEFMILSTNGTVILSTVVVDEAVGTNTSRVAVTSINSTTFVIGHASFRLQEQNATVFDITGTRKAKANPIDDVLGTRFYDIGITSLGDRFAYCYIDQNEGDADLSVYLNNGSQVGIETNLDINLGQNSNLDNLIDCVAINSTRGAATWFDNGADDAVFNIVNEFGSKLYADTVLDNDVGNFGRVAITTLYNDRFAVAFHDSLEEDITIAIWDKDNNVRLAPTDVEINTGTQSRIAMTTIKNQTKEYFVLAWLNNTGLNITAAVFDDNGTLITPPFKVDDILKGNYSIISVVGKDQLGNSICPGKFAIAYTNFTQSTVVKTYHINGSTWDGNCEEIPQDQTTCNTCADCTSATQTTGALVKLGSNLSINSTSNCIEVGADHVTVDCGGFKISDPIFAFVWAISINNRNNITIKDCVTTRIYDAISIGNSNNINILTSNLTAEENLIFSSGVTNLTLQDNILNSSIPLGSNYNVYLDTSNNILIRDNYFITSTNPVIYSSGSRNIQMINNLVNQTDKLGNFKIGLLYFRYSNNITINNNTIITNSNSYDSSQIVIAASNYTYIYNNNLTNNKQAPNSLNASIYITNFANANPKYTFIENNTIYSDENRTALRLEHAENANIDKINITVLGRKSKAIEILNSTNITVKDSNLVGIGRGATATIRSHGVYAEGSSNISITGSKITNFTRGIEIFHVNTSNLSNNILRASLFNIYVFIGYNNTISKNIIHLNETNDDEGIEVTNSGSVYTGSGNIVSDNLITDFGDSTSNSISYINTFFTSFAIVKNNVFVGSSKASNIIYVPSSISIYIINNTFNSTYKGDVRPIYLNIVNNQGTVKNAFEVVNNSIYSLSNYTTGQISMHLTKEGKISGNKVESSGEKTSIIYISSSNNITITDNTLISNNTNTVIIKSIGTSPLLGYINISFNKITSNNTAIFLGNITDNFISNNNINIIKSTLLPDSNAVILSGEVNNTQILSNNITLLSMGTGIILNNTRNSNILIKDSIINASQGDALQFIASANNTVIDSFLYSNISANFYDINSTLVANGLNPTNTFINTTFNKSKVFFHPNSNLLIDVKWYLSIYVNYINSTPVSGANVTIRDKNNNFVYQGFTNPDGYINTTSITEFTQNFSIKTFPSNYTINVSINPSAIQSINMTSSMAQNIVLSGAEFFYDTWAGDVGLAPLNNETFVLAWVNVSSNSTLFKIQHTNGTLKLAPVTVATSVGANVSRVSVSTINSTTFIVGYTVFGLQDDNAAVYDITGTLKATAGPNDGIIGTSGYDLAVTSLGDRFTYCYYDQEEEDLDIRTYMYNGSLVGSEFSFDGIMGSQRNLSNILDCAAINSTRVGVAEFDQVSGTQKVVKFNIINELSTELYSDTHLDSDVGSDAQVAITSLYNDKAAIAFYDSIEQKIKIAIKGINNNYTLSPTDVLQNVGSTTRIATATIRNQTKEFFVLVWLNNSAQDVTGIVFDDSGAIVTNAFLIENSLDVNNYRILSVTGKDQLGNSICPGKFVVAYTNSSASVVTKSYHMNGSQWDGNCITPSTPPQIKSVELTDTGTYSNCNKTICSLTPLRNSTVINMQARVSAYDAGGCSFGTHNATLYLCTLEHNGIDKCNPTIANFTFVLDSLTVDGPVCNFTFTTPRGPQGTPPFYWASRNYTLYVNLSENGNETQEIGSNSTHRWFYQRLISIALLNSTKDETTSLKLGDDIIELDQFNPGTKEYNISNWGNVIVNLTFNSTNPTNVADPTKFWNLITDPNGFIIDDEAFADYPDIYVPSVNITYVQQIFGFEGGLRRCSTIGCNNQVNETLSTHFHIRPPLGLAGGTYNSLIIIVVTPNE